MEARKSTFSSFLQGVFQFKVPIYQRVYSWEKEQCRQLWNDIFRAGSDKEIKAHFVGSIVYIKEDSPFPDRASCLVIDGQQRLTTITLLLAALANALGDDEPIDGYSARRVRNNYLLNQDEEDKRRYKLLLSQTDRETLISIVSQKNIPADGSITIKKNYEFFEGLLTSHKGKLDIVCRGLAKLMLVDIALDRSQDNPQLIFESLNSTGVDLSQADLIRNFVLMGLEEKPQKQLYEDYWRPMEVAFGQKAYDEDFNPFMRYYIAATTGVLPVERRVYDEFKKLPPPSSSSINIEPLLRKVKDYASYYCAMALRKETDSDLKLVFDDLCELGSNVMYPLLLEFYHDYKSETLAKKKFVEAVRMIESYLFRRGVCGMPTNSLNRAFAAFSQAPKKAERGKYLESIKAYLLVGLPPSARLPSDEEFKLAIQTRNLYESQSLRDYLFRRFENYGRKEKVSITEYTIEHIMPQTLSPRWHAELGGEWKRVHETWLHTLGNLTLTGYNSKYGNKLFSEKRDMEGGFKESPLRINDGLRQLDTWNETKIKKRAQKLAEKALKIWPAPFLSDAILATYKQKKTARRA